jgi:outer membrane lipase/esterase
MSIRKKVLPALILSAFAAFAAPAQAQTTERQFSNVYVFGDSLSDAGFYRGFLAGLGLPPAVVSQLGRFTTNPGPVWSELVAQYYGASATPSNVSNGNIFAQGGARVAENSASTPPGLAQRPVSTQIGEYLARGGGAADPDALYFVWAGGNDFLQNIGAFQAGQITQAQLQANLIGTTGAAAAEIGQIVRLRNAGARYIAVFGLPNIGLAPASIAGGAAAVGAATQLSAGYNTTLFTGLQTAGVRFLPVDVFSLITEIAASPAAFGFTNITGIACGPFTGITTSGNSQFCLPSNLVSPNAASTFLFADAVHPTAATHAVIAQFVESLIDGPTQYSYMAEAALRNREGHMRTVRDALLAPPREGRGLGVFVGADASDFDIDAGIGGLVGADNRNRGFTVGVTARAGESVVVGAAVGKSRTKGSFGRDAGGYRVDDQMLSLFGGMRWAGFYAAAIGTISDLEFNDISRSFSLGQVRRTTHAETDGSNASLRFTAGYDFPLGPVRLGPTFGITSQSVTVNGFDEADGGSAGLRLHEQRRRSEVWSVGVRASATFGGWTPWIRVTADKERRDDVRVVSATPLTLASIGNIYDVPAYRSDNKFTTVGIGVTGNITRAVTLSASYYTVSRSGIDESGFGALVAVNF